KQIRTRAATLYTCCRPVLDPAFCWGWSNRVFNTAPAITAVRPAPNARTKDRTPTISATVRDAQTDLAKSNIRLFVDGRRTTGFSYNQSTDRLVYTSRLLPFGRHVVRIIANDAVLDDREVAETGCCVGRDAEGPLVLEFSLVVSDREAVQGTAAGGAGVASGRERDQDRPVERRALSDASQPVAVRVGGQRRALAHGLLEPVNVLQVR
ncbi:MAG: hypothetical protein M3157_07095, partial [Actinomycetota bacterium]|nr:hypothetical protein [Actinomycetota bacterium]